MIQKDRIKSYMIQGPHSLTMSTIHEALHLLIAQIIFFYFHEARFIQKFSSAHFNNNLHDIMKVEKYNFNFYIYTLYHEANEDCCLIKVHLRKDNKCKYFVIIGDEMMPPLDLNASGHVLYKSIGFFWIMTSFSILSQH